MTSVNNRAPLRWAGSKKKLLPVLVDYWQADSKRYVEAFAGSAALFFKLGPKVALLNDKNEELIFALLFLRDNPLLLHEYLLNLPVSSEFYYRLRSQTTEELDPCARAGRFFYLNRFCFNGIYRTNLKGEFNVPYAPVGSGTFLSISEWLRCSAALKLAELQSQDFESFLLNNVVEGDFVYLDPPYAVTNRRIFSQYSAETFGVEDLSRLAMLMAEIDRRGASFLVSYAQSPETKLLTGDWHVKRTYAQRNVAGFSKHRRKAMEVLISNRLPISGV